MSTEISFHLMSLVFVVFITTLYLLNIWLFRPLIYFMQKRDDAINQDTQEITDSEKEVIFIQKEIEQIISQAKIEAKQMTDDALNEAKSVYDAKIARHRMENQSKIDDFLQKLAEDKRILKTKLLENKQLLQNALHAKIKEI